MNVYFGLMVIRGGSLWVIYTLTPEFTSPRAFKKIINCLAFLCNNSVTSRVLIIHEHWPPTSKIQYSKVGSLDLGS